MTLEAMNSTTSSPGSASGAMRPGAQDGPTTGGSPPVHAPASLSVRQAAEAGLLTSGTYGPRSTISSESAAFLSSLASRLQAKTASLGSTLYRLTWKDRVTPEGRSISALRASVRPISVSVYTLHGWSTPTCPVNTNGHQAGNNRYVTSVTSVTKPLDHAIRGRLTASGEMEIGSCAEALTENQSGAPLRPGHSRWLMGLPEEWDFCGGMGTRSTPKSRRASSKP